MQSGNSSSLKGLKLSRSPATLRLVDPIPCSQRGAASSWRGFTYISHIEHGSILATHNDDAQPRAWHEQVTSCAASSPRFARDLVKVRANVVRGSRKCQGWFAQRLRKVCKSEVRANGWHGSRNELWRFARMLSEVRASVKDGSRKGFGRFPRARSAQAVGMVRATSSGGSRECCQRFAQVSRMVRAKASEGFQERGPRKRLAWFAQRALEVRATGW